MPSSPPPFPLHSHYIHTVVHAFLTQIGPAVDGESQRCELCMSAISKLQCVTICFLVIERILPV